MDISCNSGESGDLTQLKTICEWATACEYCESWDEVVKTKITDILNDIIKHGDNASFRVFAEQPKFALFKRAIVERYGFYYQHGKNPLFRDLLRETLLPYVVKEDAANLRALLRSAIEERFDVPACDLYDAFWLKATDDVSSHDEHVVALYSDFLLKQKSPCDKASLAKTVVRFGIFRHIHVFCSLINETFDDMDIYTKCRVMEWACDSNIKLSEMPCLRKRDYEFSSVKQMCREHQFFTSKIYIPGSQLILNEKSIVPIILDQMKCCASVRRKNDMQSDISWLLSEICKAMENRSNKRKGTKFKPILVGSAAESTQALYIDEFDYLLVRVGGRNIDLFDIATFRSVVSDIACSRHHPRLVLDTMYLRRDAKFPCLQIAWMNRGLQPTLISIDLVDSVPLNKPVTLPHHNFLPVSRVQTPVTLPHDNFLPAPQEQTPIRYPRGNFLLFNRKETPLTFPCHNCPPMLHTENPVPCLQYNLLPVHSEEKPSTPSSFPQHQFLPVLRKKKRVTPHHDLHESKPVNSRDVPLCTQRVSLGLYVECTASKKIVFSQIENGVIKALPAHAIEGYRIAKAIRITHVIKPIVPKLIYIGVTDDIHHIIRTYHLKTCVFYVTQYYVYDKSDTEANNAWTFAIAVYEKLRECVLLGEVKEFFATDRYMFRGKQLECKHSEEEFTVDMPRFRCCRVRKARLLIVDQILRVLRDSQSQYDAITKVPLGKALSSVQCMLRLI